MKNRFLTVLLAALAFGAVSCAEEGAAEKLGKDIDNAAENASDAADEAIEDGKDMLDDVKDAVDDATDGN